MWAYSGGILISIHTRNRLAEASHYPADVQHGQLDKNMLTMTFFLSGFGTKSLSMICEFFWLNWSEEMDLGTILTVRYANNTVKT